MERSRECRHWVAVGGTDRSRPILINLPKAWHVQMWLCQPNQRINSKVVMGGTHPPHETGKNVWTGNASGG